MTTPNASREAARAAVQAWLADHFAEAWWEYVTPDDLAEGVASTVLGLAERCARAGVLQFVGNDAARDEQVRQIIERALAAEDRP